MESFDYKSICRRLIDNVKALGIVNESKQASLQFNIWKQSIQQRVFDEMVYSTGFSVVVIIAALNICYDLSLIKD